MFIVVEGADAVGKNTLTESLLALLKTGRNATKVSFPRYETPVGKLIRDHLTERIFLDGAAGSRTSVAELDAASSLMFQCLMLADKVDAASVINLAIANGDALISDRYWQSAYVYGKVEGLDPSWLLRTHALLPKADVNILLDLPQEEALRRRPAVRDRNERDRAKMAAVRQAYLDLWSEQDPERWYVVDAMQSPEMVLKCAKDIVNKLSQAK